MSTPEQPSLRVVRPGELPVEPPNTTPPSGALREWPLATVLAVAMAGLVTAGLGHFRRGAVLIGVAVSIAGLLRLMLPSRSIGMLAVRTRVIDVICLGVLALALIGFALWIPGLRP